MGEGFTAGIDVPERAFDGDRLGVRVFGRAVFDDDVVPARIDVVFALIVEFTVIVLGGTVAFEDIFGTTGGIHEATREQVGVGEEVEPTADLTRIVGDDRQDFIHMLGLNQEVHQSHRIVGFAVGDIPLHHVVDGEDGG